MLLLQSAVTPGWVGPTVALSLVIIAVGFVAIAGAALLLARRAAEDMQRLTTLVESLRTDLTPALTAVQAVSAEGRRLADLVGGEAEELVNASRALREGLRERIVNLEAIYGILEEEVEETAVEVALTLRSLRQGTRWFSRIRRWLRAGRRR
jgi:hypothetical protein